MDINYSLLGSGTEYIIAIGVEHPKLNSQGIILGARPASRALPIGKK